jgi:hypothetical protein
MRYIHGLKGVTQRERLQSEDIWNLFEVNKMTDDVKEY